MGKKHVIRIASPCRANQIWWYIICIVYFHLNIALHLIVFFALDVIMEKVYFFVYDTHYFLLGIEISERLRRLDQLSFRAWRLMIAVK